MTVPIGMGSNTKRWYEDLRAWRPQPTVIPLKLLKRSVKGLGKSMQVSAASVKSYEDSIIVLQYAALSACFEFDKKRTKGELSWMEEVEDPVRYPMPKGRGFQWRKTR